MVTLPVQSILRKAAINAAASAATTRNGLGARIRIIGGPRPRRVDGLGFYYGGDYSFDSIYDPYYDSYDYYDYGYGYGGDYGANPPDSSVWDNYGWYDDQSGLYVDQYGNFYDLTGGGDGVNWVDDSTIRIDTYDYASPNWDNMNWDASAATWGGVDWNAPDSSWSDYALDEWLDYAAQYPIGSPTYDPVYNPPPPKTAPKADKLAWLKKMAQEAAKRTAGSSAAGAASGGARQQTAQPNARGQCPTGFVKNPATGQCVRLQQGVTPQSGFEAFASNPLYLGLAAIGLILLAKR